MVEFGRRRAVGVVLAEATAPGVAAKPLLARVRSDGPLLGDLARRLARHVAEHYLAPPGMVVRAMLPPGMLERIELFAVPLGRAAQGGESAQLEAAVVAAGASGVRVDDLPQAASRATLLRSLRQLEAEGALAWSGVSCRPPHSRGRSAGPSSRPRGGRRQPCWRRVDGRRDHPSGHGSERCWRSSPLPAMVGRKRRLAWGSDTARRP